MKIVFLIVCQFIVANCTFLSDNIPKHLPCSPFELETINITKSFFGNLQIHHVDALDEGFDSVVKKSLCSFDVHSKTVHTLEFFSMLKKSNESSINPYSTVEGFIFNGTIKIFRTKFLPSMANRNPLAKCMFVTNSVSLEELEMTLKYAWQKFRIGNILVLLKETSEMKFCIFNPFYGLNGHFQCFGQKILSISYEEAEKVIKNRNKNLNKYPIKVTIIYISKIR